MWNYLVKNYGYDSGHMLLGVLLALTLHSLAILPAWACGLIGGLAYGLPKEIYDKVTKPHLSILDGVADLLSYQVSWPTAYAAAFMPWHALIALGVVALLYLPLVYLKLRPWET